VGELNPVIHQPTRLRIMAALVSLGAQEKADFTFLRDLLDLTDGNLGSHLRTLEDAGYVAVEKDFIARRPKTWVRPTAKGRAALSAHVDALAAIVGLEPGGRPSSQRDRRRRSVGTNTGENENGSSDSG
jgi:DNA-binding MarR family transcriptional regulator